MIIRFLQFMLLVFDIHPSLFVLPMFLYPWICHFRGAEEAMKGFKYVRYRNLNIFKTKKKAIEHFSLKIWYVTYLLEPIGRVFPCFLNAFSFASSMSSFHFFSGNIGGRSYLGLIYKLSL